MADLPAAVLACPLCTRPLTVTEEGASCVAGHRFDVARQGYLNLAVGGRKAPARAAGDDVESLHARRRFLDAGHYQPIRDELAIAVGERGILLDLGCGEGYYTVAPPVEHRFGLDVAKLGVRLAASRDPAGFYIVASAYRLPILDHSIDVVTSVFAPRPVAEVHRVLRPGGRAVFVTPASGHLAELVPPSERRELRDAPPPGAADARRLTFPLDLDPDDQADLIRMTPLNWSSRTRAEPAPTVTVDVWISTYL